MRRDLFAWRYRRVVATPKAWTAGCEATEGRSYGTILSEKPGGKSTSRSAYALLRDGITECSSHRRSRSGEHLFTEARSHCLGARAFALRNPSPGLATRKRPRERHRRSMGSVVC